MPAAENTIGTMLEIPMPASAKPAIATVVFGASPMIASPQIAIAPQIRSVITAPRRSRMRSPANRMIAMVSEKPAKAKPERATDAPSSLRM
ncbi:hypothetical protein D3C73_1568890 [compost metagenome]